MLGKLFKHEMRATARTFLWLYIAFAAIAVVSAVVAPWSPLVSGSSSFSPYGSEDVTNTVPGALQVVMFVLYTLAVVAMGIVTIVVIILRFYRNLLGDEGYLMMTLPVSREEHILSKLLAAVIWSVCTTIIILLSILLFITVSGHFGEMVNGISESIRMGLPIGSWVSMFVLIIIVGIISSILMLYAAMAIGPNLLKNRVGGSILAYIIIYVASQFVTAGVMLIWVRPMMNSATSLSAFDPGSDMTEAYLNGVSNISSMIHAVSWMSVISCVIIGVVCWFLTQYMLKKKLNLA